MDGDVSLKNTQNGLEDGGKGMKNNVRRRRLRDLRDKVMPKIWGSGDTLGEIKGGSMAGTRS